VVVYVLRSFVIDRIHDISAAFLLGWLPPPPFVLASLRFLGLALDEFKECVANDEGRRLALGL